jgi:hypothetical protein
MEKRGEGGGTGGRQEYEEEVEKVAREGGGS